MTSRVATPATSTQPPAQRPDAKKSSGGDPETEQRQAEHESTLPSADRVLAKRVGDDVDVPTRGGCRRSRRPRPTAPSRRRGTSGRRGPAARPAGGRARESRRRRHSWANSCSPSDRTPPSRSVIDRGASASRRRSRWTVEQLPVQPARGSSALAAPAIVSRSVACLSLLAHIAALSARRPALGRVRGRRSCAQVDRARSVGSGGCRARRRQRRAHPAARTPGGRTRRSARRPPATSADAPSSIRAVAAFEDGRPAAAPRVRRDPCARRRTACPHALPTLRADRAPPARRGVSPAASAWARETTPPCGRQPDSSRGCAPLQSDRAVSRSAACRSGPCTGTACTRPRPSRRGRTR